MDMYVSYILFLLGIVMIVKGSDWFVDSAAWGAKVSGIPEIIIGATIISFCTTLPETVVAVTAAFRGETDMIVGNSLGSIAANTGLILAIMFLFSKDESRTTQNYQKNGVFLILILLFTWFTGLKTGQISRGMSLILLGLFIFFLYRNFLGAKKIMALTSASEDVSEQAGTAAANNAREQAKAAAVDDVQMQKTKSGIRSKKGEAESITGKDIIKNTIFFVAGIGLVIWGAGLVVDKGVEIAESLGIPTIVIAIVFTSLGTSLPELITAIAAVRKGSIGLGMGNIIGADILNLLQVVGFSAVIAPIDLIGDKSILTFQFPIIIVLCGIAVFFNWTGQKTLQKSAGAALFCLYLVFLLVNILRENTPFIGGLIF